MKTTHVSQLTPPPQSVDLSLRSAAVVTRAARAVERRIASSFPRQTPATHVQQRPHGVGAAVGCADGSPGCTVGAADGAGVSAGGGGGSGHSTPHHRPWSSEHSSSLSMSSKNDWQVPHVSAAVPHCVYCGLRQMVTSRLSGVARGGAGTHTQHA